MSQLLALLQLRCQQAATAAAVLGGAAAPAVMLLIRVLAVMTSSAAGDKLNMLVHCTATVRAACSGCTVGVYSSPQDVHTYAAATQ